jgi:hypothetical protein
MGTMFLIERDLKDGGRMFVVDCPHARTEFVSFNPPERNALWSQLIDANKKAALDDPDVEVCLCRVPRLS